MLRDLLNSVPATLIMLGALVMTLTAVVAAVYLTRRLVPATRDGFHAEVSAPMLGVVAAVFGLLLAFVIIIGYENFLAAEANVDREGAALATIVRDSEAFPGPSGGDVRSAVGEYARSVVDDDWPQMRDGRSSDATTGGLDDIYAALRTVPPQTATETTFYDDAVRQLNIAVEARRDRIQAAKGGLPTDIAILILFSSFVLVAYSVLVGSPSIGFHLLAPVAIASVVAVSLVVLVDLTYPFSGDFAITSDSFKSGALEPFFHGASTR